MSKKLKVSFVVIGIVLLLVKLSWPVYQAMAHKGKASFLPFYQFIAIPKESPRQHKLFNEDYKKSALTALKSIDEHKDTINAPAISAAVAIDGKLIWAGAAGWADIATRKPATIDSQFRIGSTSKALTGTALARMVDAQQIKLDNSIGSYLRNLKNDRWHKITPRQLASHTAGLPHYFKNNDYLGFYRTIALSTRYEQVQQALTVFDGSDLLFEPGSQFSYSSFGTVLLSAAMEGAADMPYLDIMQSQVFTPLNMLSTKAEYQANADDQLATFYWNNKGKQSLVREWREVDLSHRLAGGGFISTSTDLVKMGAAYMQNDFISAQTRETFWTPQILPDGSETPNGYALGWRVITRKIDDDIGEVTFANHGGVSRGAQSWLMVIPEHNMSIAVNINANTEVFWHFGKVSMQLAKTFILAKNDMTQRSINSL